MKYFKWFSVILVVTAIIGVSASLFWNQFTQFKSENTSEEVVVRIGTLPTITGLSYFVAEEEGMFEGVVVEEVPFSSSNQLFEALVRGDVDVAARFSIIPLLKAQETAPVDITIFSFTDLDQASPFDSIIVLNDSEIDDIQDLEGMSIGVFPGSTATALLSSYLDAQDVNVDAIEFVKLSPSTQLGALHGGSIDALFSYEPTTAVALSDGTARRIHASVYAEILNHMPLSVAAMQTDFLEEHPDAAQIVIDAFDEAIDYIQENDTDARIIAMEVFGLEADVAEMIMISDSSHSHNLNQGLLEELLQILFAHGELSSVPDMSTLLYDSVE